MGVLPDGWRRDWSRVAAERRTAAPGGDAVHAAPAGSGAGTRRAGAAGQARGSCGGQEQSEAPLRQLRRPADGERAVRPRILVVDNDDALCEIIRESLREEYAVASAPHGAAALDLVKVHEPALILLDLRMPIMDGWSFVQQYRKLAVLPAAIVLMSATADLPGIASQLGADGHLRKPFDLGTLYALVTAHVDGRAPSPALIDLASADRPSSPPLS
jgi:CheY-like chemotaxis protein